MCKKLFFLVCLFVFTYINIYGAAKWQDWNLGGELGLAFGSGSKGGRILSPMLRTTATRILDNRFVELGIGYMYGSKITTNYTENDFDAADYSTSAEDQALLTALQSEVNQDVKERLSVIPMTVNFYYVIYDKFYVGAGIGLYHIFFKREPLGEYRANLDSPSGEIVKSPTTTAIGFQQMVGMEIFPMSDRWSWFVGLKSFITTSGGAAGSLAGMTLGGKVKYSW